MKHKTLFVSILFMILSLIIGACKSQPTLPSDAEPAIQIAATHTPPPSTSEPTIDYGALTEEELALLIYQSTVDAEATAITATTIITGVLSGTILTPEEISDALAHMDALKTSIAFTDELIDLYANQYSEIAHETIALLIAIDGKLDELTTSTNEVIALLEQDNDVTDTEQLITAIAELADQSNNVQEQVGLWLMAVQINIEEREKLYANTPPQSSLVTYNRIDAFTQAHDFMDSATTALNDGTISIAELALISQLAANAKASLYNTGDPQLFDFAQQIDVLARNLSRGEWAQASNGLTELKFSMPARPRP